MSAMNVVTVAPSQASENFFPTLAACAATSALLLLGASFLGMPPWVAMPAGMVPLMYYHWVYLVPRARKGLSHAAVDSVYYFGFLVTIAALGVSAVKLALSAGQEPLNNIAFQFGLGLLATGYAVFARMHLTSITAWGDTSGPEAVLDRYLQRSTELVTNVELASTRFAELASTMVNKTTEIADLAHTQTEKLMLGNARAFDEELRGTLASARHALTEVRGLVNETAFAQEREAFARNVKMTIECQLQLNKSMMDFAQRFREGTQTVQEVSQSSSLLNEKLLEFQGNVEQIGGPRGRMVSVGEHMTQAEQLIARCTLALGATLSELEEVSGTVSGVGKTFKSIKTLTAKAGEQMDALVISAERLESATKHIGEAADVTVSWSRGLASATENIPRLTETASDLRERLNSLSAVVARTEQHLNSLPEPAAQAIAVSGELTSALAAVHQVIAAAASDAKALAGHTSEQMTALQAARDLSGNVGTISTSVDTISSLLQTLKADVEGLSRAVAGAREALESDVSRSSRAASMFGERLTNVAQVLIDHARTGAKPS
jgi:chromosome segregation ATPase